MPSIGKNTAISITIIAFIALLVLFFVLKPSIGEFTAITTAVIAIVALWQSFNQSSLQREHEKLQREHEKLQREHDRLSVKPYLTVSVYYFYDNPNFFIRAELNNVGLGPAILKTFEVLNNRKAIKLEELGHKIIMPDFVEKTCLGFSTNCKNMAIAANQKIELFVYKGKYGGSLSDSDFDKRFQSVELKIVYSSMYDDEDYPLHHTGQDLIDLRCD